MTCYFTAESFINPFSLRNIMYSRTAVSTIVDEISNEVLYNNILFQKISEIQHIHAFDIIYLVFVLAAIRNYATKDSSRSLEKISKIEDFSIFQKQLSKVIFVFLYIFTKNIDNAI